MIHVPAEKGNEQLINCQLREPLEQIVDLFQLVLLVSITSRHSRKLQGGEGPLAPQRIFQGGRRPPQKFPGDSARNVLIMPET